MSCNGVSDYLTIIASMNEDRCKKAGLVHAGVEGYVLNRGVLFPGMITHDPEVIGEPQQCFRNAAIKAIDDDNFCYCEGYAIPDIGIMLPIHHAWVCNDYGDVMEVTWDRNGLEYYGVPFTRRFLIHTLCSRGHYGLIDNWQEHWPLLKPGDDEIREAENLIRRITARKISNSI